MRIQTDFSRKMPIGIQDFEKLRKNGCMYVDKTAYIWKMVNESTPYFLSRPRRFGKSLFLSTLKAYFLGKKELFEGLAIADYEKEWAEYPVFYLDFNPAAYDSAASMEALIVSCLKNMETRYAVPSEPEPVAMRFKNLIERVFEKTGKQVVILIDEYDKPLLESMNNQTLNEEVRAALKSFYGAIKSADACIRFTMLTGVTRFSKVSVFSDLNNLNEIGMDRAFAGICGITETELLDNFSPEMRSLAEENGGTFEEMLAKMRKNFNGYHFARNSDGVYNPFSVLNTFYKLDFNYYWFATGTPTFLFNELLRTNYNILQFKDGIALDAESIANYQPGNATPVPLLYQSGYLTITGYEKETGFYNLGFPNEEVKYGFLNNLLAFLVPACSDGNVINIRSFLTAFQSGNVEAFLTQLKAFFSSIPYDLHFDKTESYYQTIFYIVFELLGKFIAVEERSALGRADAVVKTSDAVYIFEFKLSGNGTAEDALNQINDKGYLVPYAADHRKLVKIGVVFDNKTRTIAEWKTR
jgi:hypothetical protein